LLIRTGASGIREVSQRNHAFRGRPGTLAQARLLTARRV
jgi:hypothetical protein